jgi:hypothetical protein
MVVVVLFHVSITTSLLDTGKTTAVKNYFFASGPMFVEFDATFNFHIARRHEFCNAVSVVVLLEMYHGFVVIFGWLLSDFYLMLEVSLIMYSSLILEREVEKLMKMK